MSKSETIKIEKIKNFNDQYGLALTHEEYSALEGAVDQSPYSVNDWVRALQFFDHWLKKNQRQHSRLNQIHYIQCCIEGANVPQGELGLVFLLDDYLNSYGVKN